MESPLYFPLSLHLRLDWSEMDLFGHINNVSYFKYIQAARVNYWDHTHVSSYHQKTGIGPILASTQCKFIRPLHYPGTITINTRLEFIRNTSFGLHHQIWDAEGTIVAEAHDIIVLYDFAGQVKSLIPEEIRSAISSLESSR